jgi:hypothetical protein
VVLTAAAAIAAAGDMEAIAERELIVFDERRLRSGRRFLFGDRASYVSIG